MGNWLLVIRACELRYYIKDLNLKLIDNNCCGISKMVGPKKQDFWPRINILEGKKFKITSMNDGSSKVGHDFRKYSGSKIEARK